ncbi:hypothetical protein [Salipiger pallidus]|nr:hypothetical protein [Salipiger pallidus]
MSITNHDISQSFAPDPAQQRARDRAIPALDPADEPDADDLRGFDGAALAVFGVLLSLGVFVAFDALTTTRDLSGDGGAYAAPVAVD